MIQNTREKYSTRAILNLTKMRHVKNSENVIKYMANKTAFKHREIQGKPHKTLTLRFIWYFMSLSMAIVIF